MGDQLQRAIEAWKESDLATRAATSALSELRASRHDRQLDVVEALQQAGHGTSALIGLNNTQFHIGEAKQVAPLTLTCVRQSLERCISDSNMVDAIMNVIKEDRIVKTKTVIRYTPDKAR